MTTGRAGGALALALIGASALTACGGGTEPIQQPFASISTTTTRIASANIVGLDREPGEVCAAPLAGTAAPATIAVADPTLLDGLCALGLQERVKAVAGEVPEYLSAVFGKVPELTDGDRSEVAVGTDASSDANRRGNRTVTVPAPSADWRRSFTALADAVRLPAEARTVLDAYQRDAAAASTKIDAVHQVVSLVRFTSDGKALAEGTRPLAAQVLADLKVGRPQSQTTADPVEMRADDYTAADADLIYASYQGSRGQEFGTSVMTSTQWKKLRAVVATRQLLTEDAAWYAAGGPVAARIVLRDVSNSISSSS